MAEEERCQQCGQVVRPKYRQKKPYELRLSADLQSATLIYSYDTLDDATSAIPHILKEEPEYLDSGGFRIVIEYEPREE